MFNEKFRFNKKQLNKLEEIALTLMSSVHHPECKVEIDVSDIFPCPKMCLKCGKNLSLETAIAWTIASEILDLKEGHKEENEKEDLNFHYLDLYNFLNSYYRILSIHGDEYLYLRLLIYEMRKYFVKRYNSKNINRVLSYAKKWKKQRHNKILKSEISK